MKGVLYLIPNILGNPDTSLTIPEGVRSGIRHIRLFMVEDLRNARRFLKSLDRDFPIDDLTFFEQHKHASPEEIPAFLDKVEQGSDGALLSEAGLPGVADPGAAVVSLAHERGIRVVPFTGPSSVLLALMASGMNGQSFSFHGYLPVKRPERIKKIRELEQDVIRTGETQLFIEAPYRNDALLADILETVHPSTRICVAVDLTMDTEFILTLPAGDWLKKKPALHKRPAIFLIGK